MSSPAERAFTIFDAIVARPEPEWDDALARACGDDDGLRREVESLLAAHRAASGFLSRPGRLAGHVGQAPASGMLLAPGMRLGSYQVGGLLGAGGMGEVYKARDLRLDRCVAIKVIGRATHGDPARRERFAAEARAIARLSHPRICALYDVGHHDGIDFLVMEYLEGETLETRLARGPLPLADAIRTAVDIADALSAAHAGGIVHRDIKPGNVMLTRSGVKLLDFGLARLRAALPDAVQTPSAATSPADSGVGVVLGTLRYMAPEQLEGLDVDERADVFAFGLVLYEMVTGRRPFAGESEGAALAATLAGATPRPLGEPWSSTGALDALIRTCLQRNRNERWASMHDVRLQLQAMAQAVLPPPASRDPAPAPRPRRWAMRALPWAVAVVLAAAWLIGRLPWPGESPLPSMQQFSAELGVPATLAATDTPFAVSADGTMLAFVARQGTGPPQLHVRRLAQLAATPLAGTDGASSPFFSPDGQWVAFFSEFALKKVPVTGGQAITLAAAPNHRGGCWAEDGSIVFAPGNRQGLMRVSAEGGRAHELTTLHGDEITHRWPQVLPGGRAVLYTASTAVNIGRAVTLVVQALPSGTRTVLHTGGYAGRYVPSGHLVYVENDTLFAMPFDAQRLAVTGPAASVLVGVQADSSRGSAQFAVSAVGTLAYLPGRNAFDPRPMVWMDRNGAISMLRSTPEAWSNAEFSPDGSRVAMEVFRDGRAGIFVHEWARGPVTRLTSATVNAERPVWSRDGSRITYVSTVPRRGSRLLWQLADGTGAAQVLVRSPHPMLPGSWHPTRNLLVYQATRGETGDDLMMLPVDGDEPHGWRPGAPTALVSTAAREWGPAFSPDGRWLAYHSTESGRDEVYVRPFPGPGPRVAVSSTGGETPSWSRTRPEIVFTAPGVDYARVLMVAPYRVEHGVLRVGSPRPWSARQVALRHILGERMYALHPDGLRVAIAAPRDEAGRRDHVTFVLNFLDALRRIAPPPTNPARAAS